MRIGRGIVLRGVVLLGPIALTGCQAAVLDPRGLVGIADKTILLDSLAIMLAIVVPTIARDVRFRLVVPRVQHAGDAPAGFRLFRAAGTAGLGDPGADDHPAGRGGLDRLARSGSGGAAGRRGTKPLEVQVVSLDWKWLFIYPDQHIASVNQLVIPAGTPVHFSADLGQRDERVLRPAARQHDLHDERHGDAAVPAGGRAGHLPRPLRPIQRRRLFRHAFRRAAVRRQQFPPGSTTRKRTGRRSSRGYAALARQSLDVTPFTYRSADPGSVQQIVTQSCRRARAADRASLTSTSRLGRSASMLGKLTWAAIPFDQPIPLVAAALVGAGVIWRARLDHGQGLAAVSVARVDHQRRSQAHRHDVLLLALVMLLRGFVDAIMMRSQQALAFRSAGVSAAGALRSDLLRARHADDLLRGDAVRDRADEFRRAAAARRARRRVPDAELGGVLADRDGRAAGQYLAGGGRVRPHRLAAVSAAVGD